jgi:transcriptional regulator with XRE-family HTH domain
MTTRHGMLRALRLEKRLTQDDVARKLKVSQSYYSPIERGLKPAAEVEEAIKVVARMRLRTDRTAGGRKKAGREK